MYAVGLENGRGRVGWPESVWCASARGAEAFFEVPPRLALPFSSQTVTRVLLLVLFRWMQGAEPVVGTALLLLRRGSFTSPRHGPFTRFFGKKMACRYKVSLHESLRLMVLVECEGAR